MTTFVALFDLHFGWEMRRVNGSLRKSPTHDLKLFENVASFVKDFSPDVLILGGDNLNASFLSRHNRGKPRLVEQFRAKDEYDAFNEKMLVPLEDIAARKNTRKIFLLGNHERWIEDFLDENPTVEGIIEPESYLKLGARMWEVIDYGKLFKLGKLYFAHGDAIRTAAKYRAATLLASYQRNIITGHSHTLQVHLSTGLQDGQPHASWIVPMMGATNPDYLKGAPTNWAQGFVFGAVWPNGNFNVVPVIATNGKFAAAAQMPKLYGETK